LTDSNISTEDFRAVPIEFMLPNDLPSSLSSTYGNISYQVKASVHTPGQRKQRSITTFGVKGVRDLSGDNEKDTLDEKLTGSEVKTMCSFLTCQMDHLNYSVTLPKKGFAIGEEFKVTIELQNDSDHSFENVLVQLLQVFFAL